METNTGHKESRSVLERFPLLARYGREHVSEHPLRAPIAVVVPGWEVPLAVAKVQHRALVSHAQAHLGELQRLQREQQRLKTESVILYRKPVLPAMPQAQRKRNIPSSHPSDGRKESWFSSLPSLRAAVEQGQRRLRVWKTTQAALAAAGQVDSGIPEHVTLRPCDPATYTLCACILEQILEKALQRIDHRPDVKMIQRERRMWDDKRAALQENVAQQCMLRSIRHFVHKTVVDIHTEVIQERQCPTMFASQILARAIAKSSRYHERGNVEHESQPMVLQQVLCHMQLARGKADRQGEACFRHHQALQISIPPELQQAQQLLAAAFDHPSSQYMKPANQSWATLVIPAGPEACIDHQAASLTEISYWEDVKFIAACEPYRLPEASGAITDVAVHHAGFCMAICTGNGYLHVLDLRWGPLKEIYAYPRPLAASQSNIPAAAQIRRRGKQQLQPELQAQGNRPVSDRELCGAAFGTMGNLAALRSNGSILVLLLRPAVTSPEDLDSPMVPTCLTDLPTAAQVATGKAALQDGVTSVASTTAQQEVQCRAHRGEWIQRVTIKSRPCYAAEFSVTGARPHIACPQSTGDALCFATPGGARLLRGCQVEPPLVAGTGTQQLLQAQKPSVSVPVEKQQLFRFHSAQIVYLTSLLASGELLTVDLVGSVAVWPPPWSSQSGLGWVEPTRVLQLQKSMLVPQLGRELALPAEASQERPVWMVTYQKSLKQLVRHVIYRSVSLPDDQGLARSVAMVETFLCDSGSLISKRAFHVRGVHAPSRVVAAAMSPGQEMLVVVTVVYAAEDANVQWSSYFRFHSISCSSWKILLPVIDVPDWSAGMVAPVFSIRPQVRSLGSEYLLASLGLNVIGVFSLTTAQLMREVPLSTLPTRILESAITQLVVFTRTLQFGGRPEVRTAFKLQVAAGFGPPVNRILVLQMDDTDAEVRLLDRRSTHISKKAQGSRDAAFVRNEGVSGDPLNEVVDSRHSRLEVGVCQASVDHGIEQVSTSDTKAYQAKSQAKTRHHSGHDPPRNRLGQAKSRTRL